MIILGTCYGFLTLCVKPSVQLYQGRTHSHIGQTHDYCRCLRRNSQFVL